MSVAEIVAEMNCPRNREWTTAAPTRCRCLALAHTEEHQAKGLEIKQHLYNSPDQKVCFTVRLLTIN